MYQQDKRLHPENLHLLEDLLGYHRSSLILYWSLHLATRVEPASPSPL